MAMYLAFAFFLLPRVGWHKARWRLLCVLGIVGTVSTAGFGVFVVVLAFEWFLRTRPVRNLLTDYLRRLSGMWILAGAAWLAVNAPVLGLAAKRQINEISLSERSAATAAGWHALWNTPFGGEAANRIGGVNLIASIAASGLPFVICVVAALLSPRVWHQARPLTSAPIMVLLLTLATSQPAKDSTWAFVVAVMAYAVTAAPANAEVDADNGSTTSTRGSQMHARELRPQLSAVMRLVIPRMTHFAGARPGVQLLTGLTYLLAARELRFPLFDTDGAAIRLVTVVPRSLDFVYRTRCSFEVGIDRPTWPEFLDAERKGRRRTGRRFVGRHFSLSASVKQTTSAGLVCSPTGRIRTIWKPQCRSATS
jgi:hypothetical protein